MKNVVLAFCTPLRWLWYCVLWTVGGLWDWRIDWRSLI